MSGSCTLEIITTCPRASELIIIPFQATKLISVCAHPLVSRDTTRQNGASTSRNFSSGCHCNDGIMSLMVSQITSLTIVYSTIFQGTDERKHQSSASLAHSLVNSPHKGPVTRKMFPFDDFIMSRQFEKYYGELNQRSLWNHRNSSKMLPLITSQSPTPQQYYMGECVRSG